MSESPPTKFRAIVVGAGPVGLYLAHALSHANIEYIVLEQHETVLRYQGAGVFLYPQTLRLLDQIGLYKEAEIDLFSARTQMDLFTSNGQVIKSTPLWSKLAEKHAYPVAGLSRAQLIMLLYNNLPEKETRVKTGAAVVDVDIKANGVKVHLKDGSTEEGSIIIGVDGVHSKTRHVMQQKQNQAPPDTWPMNATYQGLYGCFHPVPGFEPGTFYQSRGAGIISQMLAGEDRGHFAVLQPITPTTDSKRYTTEDRDRFAEEVANVIVAPGVRFQDVWAATDKATAAMVDQEEGYCDKWYHQRVVLAGDAVHKSTSATGLGANTGINSAAVLANELYRELASEPDPCTTALEEAFARYQKIRTPEATRLHGFGREQIRKLTWETWTGWFWDRIIHPWVGVDKVVAILGKLIERGQILEYVPFHDRNIEVPWIHKPKARL